jgi:hypothetical protein
MELQLYRLLIRLLKHHYFQVIHFILTIQSLKVFILSPLICVGGIFSIQQQALIQERPLPIISRVGGV